MSLVHHVCKEAPGLESLFLISKSNCAFANFKDEATCIAAQQKLHDSKFQTVRLVSRLRKSTVEGATGVTAPTGPAASASVEMPTSTEKATDLDGGDVTSEQPVTPASEPQRTPDLDSSVQKDRFFILKSLTMEDLELSVRTGIWATQSHNEDVLNKAFNVSLSYVTYCLPQSSPINLSTRPLIMSIWYFQRINRASTLGTQGWCLP